MDGSYHLSLSRARSKSAYYFAYILETKRDSVFGQKRCVKHNSLQRLTDVIADIAADRMSARDGA